MASTENEALARLTARERQVLHLLAEGLTVDELANRLGVGIATVRAHRGRIMRKLDISSEGELIRFALRETMPS